MKSIVSLLAMSPDRSTAANWATELEKNGFAHHTADEIKKALQVSLCVLENRREQRLSVVRRWARIQHYSSMKIRWVHLEVNSSDDRHTVWPHRHTMDLRGTKGE